MPADLNADLALSTSVGSPPAVRYRTPPMVRYRVATAARIPMIHARRLSMTCARPLVSGAARGVPATWANAGTAGTRMVGTRIRTVAAVSMPAAWMSLWYMVLAPPAPRGAFERDGDASPGVAGKLGRGSLAPSQRCGGRCEHGPASRSPGSGCPGGAGNPNHPPIRGRRSDSLPTQGPLLGTQQRTRSREATQQRPNRNPTAAPNWPLLGQRGPTGPGQIRSRWGGRSLNQLADRRLPIPIPPAFCEVIDSYLDRLTEVSHLRPDALRSYLTNVRATTATSAPGTTTGSGHPASTASRCRCPGCPSWSPPSIATATSSAGTAGGRSSPRSPTRSTSVWAWSCSTPVPAGAPGSGASPRCGSCTTHATTARTHPCGRPPTRKWLPSAPCCCPCTRFATPGAARTGAPNGRLSTAKRTGAWPCAPPPGWGTDHPLRRWCDGPRLGPPGPALAYRDTATSPKMWITLSDREHR